MHHFIMQHERVYFHSMFTSVTCDDGIDENCRFALFYGRHHRRLVFMTRESM
jgi:hypothetical protein